MRFSGPSNLPNRALPAICQSVDVALLCPASGCMLQQQQGEGMLPQPGFASTDWGCVCRRRQ